jgi:hypothetical protein
MTQSELVQEIKDALSFSCALPYSLNDQEIERIIKRAKAWFYDNYQYAVEERIFVLGKGIFAHPEFRATRQLTLPDSIITVYEVRDVGGSGIGGSPDKDFGDSKLLGSELLLSPFIGDNLVYRTVMYSYFDLARAYLLATYAFKWNKNSKRLTILGRDPSRSGLGNSGSANSNLANGFASGNGGYDISVRCFVAIGDEYLFNDELFVRYVIGKSKSALGKMLGTFTYNLPGGVTVNSSELVSTGDAEVQEVMDMINGENSPSYFLQWN